MTMNPNAEEYEQDHEAQVYLYALRTLNSSEVAAFETHLSECVHCQKEFEAIKPVVTSFVAWPTDVLRPGASLWQELSKRISEGRDTAVLEPRQLPITPEWEEVASGISVKILATDTGKQQVSMLVRLAPGTDYPPHCHAEAEELYLLSGELMIDQKKLCPGDYYHADGGTIDHRVWTETGCTCVLLTSTKDAIL